MVLMNVIAPYHKPMLDRLTKRFGALRVLLSTPMESNRPWKLEWAGLDVAVQKTVTLNRRWHHPQGFSEPLFVHLPLDTPLQLRRWRPDVVISWEMGMRTILSAAYCALSRAKLMVWAEFAESTEFGRGAMRQRIRRILHRAVDGFLVTGDSGVRYLRTLGVRESKLYKIAYTVDVGRFAEAGACYRQAIALRPDFADGHLNLGLFLLLNGHFEEGWREYAWYRRSSAYTNRPREFSTPVWDGASAAGKGPAIAGNESCKTHSNSRNVII